MNQETLAAEVEQELANYKNDCVLAEQLRKRGWICHAPDPSSQTVLRAIAEDNRRLTEQAEYLTKLLDTMRAAEQKYSTETQFKRKYGVTSEEFDAAVHGGSSPTPVAGQ